MRLQHEFTLPIPPEQAWAALLDVRRVAPCMPGATLDHADGDAFAGRVAVRIGPLRLDYRGEARIAERDAAAGRLVIAAHGREAGGPGTAEATVTAALSAAAEGTRVALDTDLALTGRPARFGHGLVSEVGDGLVGRFAGRLAAELRTGATAGDLPAAPPLPATTTPTAPAAPDPAVPAAPAAPADPGGTGAPGRPPGAGKRVLAAVAAGLLLVVGAYWLGRRGRGRSFFDAGRG